MLVRGRQKGSSILGIVVRRWSKEIITFSTSKTLGDSRRRKILKKGIKSGESWAKEALDKFESQCTDRLTINVQSNSFAKISLRIAGFLKA